MTQIALPLSFDRQFSFDNYFTDQAGFIVSSLKAFVEDSSENFIILWGGHDSGKTHLLNASAHYARGRSRGFQLYDADQLSELEPSCLEEFADGTILAIDNLDAICGNRDWESAFYYLINLCHQQKLRLLASLGSKPQDLNCVLADFQSRLSWGLLLELPLTDETDIENIIRQRALLLGHELSEEVICYLVRHYSRGLGSQLEILRKLDTASLSTKKKITIPLIKQVMN
ncbi:MAG: hypothetical protein GY806_03570 [Gammaproteobacteria bacterium]|nr:hypothetical protein [Gammaproteobacteria bacterium]